MALPPISRWIENSPTILALNALIKKIKDNYVPTFDSLEDMKQGMLKGTCRLITENGTVGYDFVAGNFTGRADNVSIVALNNVALTAGALVRQTSDTLYYRGSSVSSYLDAVVHVTNHLYNGVVTVQSCRDAIRRLALRGGGVLKFPFGVYSLNSSDLSTGLTLPSNVTVDGDGSLVTIAGNSVFDCLFKAVDASNITIKNLLVSGNSKAEANSSSGAFFNYVHTDNGNGTENIKLINVRLQNFAAERWISILNTNSSGKTIRGVSFRDVAGFTQLGNNLGGDSISIGSNFVMIYGVNSPIIDIDITNLYIEGFYIKCGLCLFHKVQNVVVNKPRLLSIGRLGTQNDKGAYAINIYADRGELFDVTINSPTITDPRSCGIYVRGADDVEINKPVISGQTDTASETLPKGAIVTNASTNVRINGGTLSNNVYDMNFVALTNSSSFDHAVDGTKMFGASNCAVVLNPTNGTGSPTNVVFTNCDVDAVGRAFQALNNIAGRSLTNIVIQGGRWTSLGTNAIELNPLSGAIMKNYRIKDAFIASAYQGINANNSGGDLTVSDCVFADSGGGSQLNGLAARNVPQLHLINLLFRDQPSGNAIASDGALGSVKNVRFINCASPFAPESLGSSAPSGGQVGWVVENLSPSAGGPWAWIVTNVGVRVMGQTVA